jgi:hypothetical protein
MPKHFSTSYSYRGFFENNDYYTYQTSGTYEAPSDWVIYIVYNTHIVDGSIHLTSKVVDYEDADVSKIEKEW